MTEKIIVTEEQKREMIEDFIKISSKHILFLFDQLDLKTHIESVVINPVTNDEYLFSFKKINSINGK